MFIVLSNINEVIGFKSRKQSLHEKLGRYPVNPPPHPVIRELALDKLPLILFCLISDFQFHLSITLSSHVHPSGSCTRGLRFLLHKRTLKDTSQKKITLFSQMHKQHIIYSMLKYMLILNWVEEGEVQVDLYKLNWVHIHNRSNLIPTLLLSQMQYCCLGVRMEKILLL